jgi:hypothetical protein
MSLPYVEWILQVTLSATSVLVAGVPVMAPVVKLALVLLVLVQLQPILRPIGALIAYVMARHLYAVLGTLVSFLPMMTGCDAALTMQSRAILSLLSAILFAMAFPQPGRVRHPIMEDIGKVTARVDKASILKDAIVKGFEIRPVHPFRLLLVTLILVAVVARIALKVPPNATFLDALRA